MQICFAQLYSLNIRDKQNKTPYYVVRPLQKLKLHLNFGSFLIIKLKQFIIKLIYYDEICRIVCDYFKIDRFRLMYIKMTPFLKREEKPQPNLSCENFQVTTKNNFSNF